MTDARRKAGWANYSLFLSGDGLLVGYLETDDYRPPGSGWRRPASTAAGRRKWPLFSLTSTACDPTRDSPGWPRFSTLTEH